MRGLLAMRLQEARCHHRRQRQRHHHRDENRHRKRNREFAEQPADNATHQQQRNQHRDQRNADRHDRETDFAGSLERRGVGLFAFLDISRDIFQDDDRVVDDEPDRNRQRHQRQVIERVAEGPHQRAGAKQRQRNRDAGDDGRPYAAQKNKDHQDDKQNRQQQRELDIGDRRANGLGAVADDRDFDGRRYRRNQPRQLRLDLVHGVDDVGARLFEHDEKDAALAVGPGHLLGVLGPGDRGSDVANPQWTAVAIGDDDVVPVLGLQQLIVGIDGVAAGTAIHIALGIVDGRYGELVADVLQRQSLGDQFGRIDLDADGGLLLAADGDLRHAGDLADLLRHLVVGVVIDLGHRQRIRRHREQEDRRIRRIDFPIGRRRRQAFRQLAARRIDASEDIVGGGIDASVEIELDGDRGRAQRTRRRHLRDAGNLGELSFQRLRHRRCHGFRTGAGKRWPIPGWSGSRPAATARPAIAGRRPGRRTGFRPSAAMLRWGIG